MRIRLRSAAWVFVPLLLSDPASAGDWPQFRGPGGTAVSDDTGLPVKWSATENVRWKADLPGRGVSSPVIAGGRVYLTASSGYRQGRLHVLCFDAATGKKRWERQVASTGSTMCHPKTCMAAPTPVTDGQRVFTLFATGDLAAFDRDGDLLWYRSLVRDYPDVTNQVGMAASPVLAGDTLLLPLENVGDSFAVGVDVTTGKNRWKVPRRRDINWVTPLVARLNGKTAGLFQTSREITAYDVKTGAVLWSHESDTLAPVSSPIAGDGLIIVAGNPFVALRPSDDGKPEVVWTSNKLRSGYTSPLFHKGRVYGMTGVGVNCVDAATGELVWQQRLNGRFSSSPVVADGKLYVANEDGAVSVVQLGDKPKVLAVNSVKETILATPAVAAGAIYLRTDQHLYCIAAKK